MSKELMMDMKIEDLVRLVNDLITQTQTNLDADGYTAEDAFFLLVAFIVATDSQMEFFNSLPHLKKVMAVLNTVYKAPPESTDVQAS